jgi:Flp pilus assembly protein TadG
VLGNDGALAVEFALLVPVFLLVILGGVQFGLLIKNYVTLTNAVAIGAMQFAISRSDTTPASDAWTAITNAAPTLTPTTNLEMTLTVGANSSCASNVNSLSAAAADDSTCASQLAAAAPSNGALTSATVTVTFPCGTQLTWYNFWTSSCNLSSTMTEGVQ